MEGGAEYLATIFGTEKDKVNCPFYFKIGACRHGDKCERRHNKPTLSQTILIGHMWPNTITAGVPVDEKALQEQFDDFYEDVFEEMANFGEVEELNVCENLGDHLIGNVYVKYHRDEDAKESLGKLQGRFYGGRPLLVEFSPVTDFREAVCKQFEQGECQRGGYCNFMHLKFPSRDLTRRLFRKQRRKFERRSRSRSRSPSRRSGSGGGSGSHKRRSHSRSPRRDDRGDRNDRERDRGDRDRDRDRERDSHRERREPREEERRKEPSPATNPPPPY